MSELKPRGQSMGTSGGWTPSRPGRTEVAPTSIKPLFTGIVFIDGVRASAAEMGRLNPKSIQSIDVIKGVAATTQYDDPAAVNGVIRIVTKTP